VGTVPYLVGRPMDLGLEDEEGIELQYAVPARLVEGLRSGEIDVALVSSIELFRRPEYGYIAGIGVAGRGVVSSVQLFLRKAIEDVRTVALDPSSRTARTLIRILLADGPAPSFEEVEGDGDPRELPCDAWLRIGDPALRECHGEGLAHWNPSEQWTLQTGLPFVFAPWIVAPGVNLDSHLPAFERAAQRGLAAALDLARQAAQEWDLPEGICEQYLTRECLYRLPGDEMKEALWTFRDRAGALDLCDASLKPRAITL
jgi:chorismate dehydratase